VLNNVTDWAVVYARFLSFSIADPIFQAERFGKVPVKLLQTCIRHLSEDRQERANANSIATAKLSSIVLGALGGKKVKVKLEDLLPYETKKPDNALQDSTISAMKWALKHETMPPAIIGMIGAELG
jgi:hypothetical protein